MYRSLLCPQSNLEIADAAVFCCVVESFLRNSEEAKRYVGV